MITGYDPNQLNQWRSNIYKYQKQKRTKKPFGKQPEVYDKKIVHAAQIREKQRQFDPILQKFSRQSKQKQLQKRKVQRENLSLLNHMKNHSKHQKNYDIVNLTSYSSTNNQNHSQQNPESMNYDKWVSNKNKNNPIRNVYNIISNQNLPSQYFKNRNVRLNQKPISKKLYQDQYQQRQFDFVKGQYIQDNQYKQYEQIQRQKQLIYQKSNNRKFNNITQKYYNSDLEDDYQDELHKSQIMHGKDKDQKLPPSYRNRQPCLFSYQEEKLPASVKKIKQKQQLTLKKHQMRYAIQDQYRRRNDQDFQKHQMLLKNKVHEGKILENMVKQHDIINNKLFQINRSLYYQKKIKQNPYSYDFVNKSQYNAQTARNKPTNSNENWQTQSQAYSVRSRSSADRFSNQRFSIKSGGFS